MEPEGGTIAFFQHSPVARGKDTETGAGIVLALGVSLAGGLVCSFKRGTNGFPTRELGEFDRHVNLRRR